MQEVLGPTLELCAAMNRLRKAWHEMRPTPLISKSLFSTLMSIAHSQDANFPGYMPVKLVDGCIAVSDLAMIMYVSLPVASQRVRELESMQLIRREGDLKDRRVCRVALTKEGESLVENAHRSLKLKMDATMQEFGIENMSALISTLDKLAISLEKAQNKVST